MIEFLAVVLAQRLRIDAHQAGNVGLGNAITGQRLDLAAQLGIGLVGGARHQAASFADARHSPRAALPAFPEISPLEAVSR